MAKKVAAVHICSNCIKDFSSKEIYSALKPNALLPHYTVYCEKCIKELGIEEYTPYLKSRVSKTNSETETDKPKTTKKTTAKTKTATSAKTKTATSAKTKTTSTRSKK